MSFDLRAQLEHVLEAVHVEFRVLGDAVGRIGRHHVGLRRDLRRELETIGEQRNGFRLVGGVERPAAAFDTGADIAHERVAVGLRPLAHEAPSD